ncbi:MAG: SIR2 family NAD-dependent protein deacylase [Gemmataceae bacterium]
MMKPFHLDSQIERAVEALQSADALLIGAGAGMGVDSGLPDFRGGKGFWNGYPPFRGHSFADISVSSWFHRDPVQAWGFQGHCLNLFREKQPHEGFALLRRWGERFPLGYFVYTSNIDGHFQKAGFPEDRILECHGSIHYLQCARSCSHAIWSADSLRLEVDEATLRCRSDLPLCPRCGYVARPNMVMFSDLEWLWHRYKEQRIRYAQWLRQIEGKKVVAVEIGAGVAIPTVREECEREGQTLIRINPGEADPPAGGIALPLVALEALRRLDTRLQEEATVG